MSILKALTLLGFYWLISASSFIWASIIAKEYNWMRILLVIGLLLVVLSLIILFTLLLKKYLVKELVVAIPILISLAGIFLILWILDVIVTRFIVLSMITSTYIGVFLFLQFYEDTKQSCNENAELAHRRYLEYGRSFFWTILIILISYLAWEIQAFSPRSGNEEPFPFILGNLGEALQLFIVVAVGGGLVFLGFHYKMREIEKFSK